MRVNMTRFTRDICILRQGLEVTRGCRMHITLKDMQTKEEKPERLVV
jgi:hypothetical protein